MAHQSLWNRCIYSIHGHMVSVVGRPAECQLRQISCTYNHSVFLVCDIHKYLCALACLSILVGDIMHRRILSDIPEMYIYGILYIHLDKCSSKAFNEIYRIVICAVCCSKARHSNCRYILVSLSQKVKCSHRDKQCQCGVESS